MTKILQISDTHIVARGDIVSGRLETSDPLKRLVQRIEDSRAEIGPIDALLISGDLSDDGSEQSYQHIRDLVAPLNLPTYVIPGNHDMREPLSTAFLSDGYLPETGPLNWVRRIGDIHLIGLDTLIEGHRSGALDQTTLTFLSNTLESIASGPVLLALHHPPFRTGIHFMDEIGLGTIPELSEILSKYKGELRIACGHIHTMMTVAVAGHVAISAPSPSSEFAYDTRADAPVGFREIEGGCLLHTWDTVFQTARIGPVAGAGPFPFKPA
ncbi:phosphodiesterase [Amylibacter sp.]|nr:phosphodiesterase [Amylibacter sp.]